MNPVVTSAIETFASLTVVLEEEVRSGRQHDAQLVDRIRAQVGKNPLHAACEH